MSFAGFVGAVLLSLATLSGVSRAATGIDWGSATASPAANCMGVGATYGKGMFIAVCRNTTKTDAVVMYSYDGRTWSNSGVTGLTGLNGFVGVGFGAGRFVAVTDAEVAEKTAYSDDGKAWTTVNLPTSGARGVAYGDGRFVAVGFNKSGPDTGSVAFTSPDATSWTRQLNVPAGNYRSVAYGKANGAGIGTFVAVATSNSATPNRIITSTDGGETWTVRTPPWTHRPDPLGPAVPGSLVSVTYGNGQFVTVCADTCGATPVFTSPDGVTWTARTAPTQAWSSVVMGQGFGVNAATSSSGVLYVAVADNATSAPRGVMTSGDGVVWTARDPGIYGKWQAVAFGNGTFVAVYSIGVILPFRGLYSGSACGDGVPFTKLPDNAQTYLQYAPPCAAAGTVGDTLGTAPDTNVSGATYGSQWVVFGRNAANSANTQLALTSSLSSGSGYWFGARGLPTNQPVSGKLQTSAGNVAAYTNIPECMSLGGCAVVGLNTTSAGKKMLGNPFGMEPAWSDVRIRVGGAGGAIYTPSQAEAANILGSQIWIWNGSSYDTWNDSTNPGNLRYSQGFFIDLLPGGVGRTIEVLVPYGSAGFSTGSLLRHLGRQFAALSDASGSLLSGLIATPAHAAASGNWKVKLSAKSPDRGTQATAVLGQFAGSLELRDRGDLVAMPPFAAPNLSVVFPRTDWGAASGDYAGDFRPAKGIPRQWPFEVRADKAGGTVVLTWQGSRDVLSRSRLIDAGTGQTIDPRSAQYANGYSFTMTSTVRRMTWSYLGDAAP